MAELNASFDSYLDDAPSYRDDVYQEKEEEEIPMIPDQPSDTKEAEEKETNNEDTTDINKETSNDNDDALTSYLKAYGVSDPSKMKFENEDGTVDEVDFNSLSKDEQLEVLRNVSDPGYTDYEKEVINFMRTNRMDLSQIVDYYSQKAIENYLNENPDKRHQKEYSIDDYTDDELFMADVKAKYPDLTDDEILNELDRAKYDEDVFKKKVDALREQYKAAEDEQENQRKANEQAEYENFQNTLLQAANGFNEILLDPSDPQSDALVVERADKERMLSYLLDVDKDGISQFQKDLNDPAALIELAYYRTHGRDDITDMTRYWKNELATARKEIASLKKKLDKGDEKKNTTVVKSQDKPKYTSYRDIWD